MHFRGAFGHHGEIVTLDAADAFHELPKAAVVTRHRPRVVVLAPNDAALKQLHPAGSECRKEVGGVFVNVGAGDHDICRGCSA